MIDGVFEGYACIFDEVDLGNDIILSDAFEKSLRAKNAQNISMLWQHDPMQPIGKWLEIKIDQKGLFVVGELSVRTRHARDVAIMIKDNIVDGLSIGFKTQKAVQKRRQAVRVIKQLDLWEISIVTFPMQPNARIIPAQTSSDIVMRKMKQMTASMAN